MLRYRADLKSVARRLRNNSTDAERLLWSRLRRKQVLGIQFYRQKPIGEYVVDFYAPRVKLVVEVDGAQRFESVERAQDTARSEYLCRQGLLVLRFDNRQVLREMDAALAVIHEQVESPPHIVRPPLGKGARAITGLMRLTDARASFAKGRKSGLPGR